MELGTGFMGLPMPTMRSFNSKAEAIQFAIEFTACYADGCRIPNNEVAKELFNFICENVELPDIKPNPADGLVEFAKKYIEELVKRKGEEL